MTTAAMGLGIAVGLVLLASFPVAMVALPDDPDLRVIAASSRPYLVRDKPSTAMPTLKVEPSPAPPGLTLVDSAPRTGLDLPTWQVNYSHRWEREVTLPILTGPFVREGEEVCGLSVAIGAGLFDTSGAGAGLSAMLGHQLGSAFPRLERDKSYPITIQFPGVAESTVRLKFGNGGVGVFADVRLTDGTRFVVFFPVAVTSRDGAPALIVKRDHLFTRWSGPTYDDLLRRARALGAAYYGAPTAAKVLCPFDLFDWFCPSESQREQIAAGMAETTGQQMAREQIAERITAAFDEVNLGFSSLRGPHLPVPGNQTAAVHLRLAENPIVSAKGVALRLCASVQIGAKVDPLVSVSVKSGSAPSVGSRPSGDATIELDADGDTLNHILYLLWQSGALRDVGTSRSLVQAVLDQTRDTDGSESALQKLAFEFKGFDPGLPPTITAAAGTTGTLGFALGDVKIGEWGERRVVAHAAGGLAISAAGDRLSLTASVKQLTANCTAPSGGGVALTPCVSDLMPTVRETLSAKPVQVSVRGGDVLAKLPTMSFGGGQVQLTNLRATTSASPVHLSVKVQARIAGASP